MSADNFSASLSHVLASEGGYVDDPKDPGGATDMGITQHVYDNWRLCAGLQTRSVHLLDPNEAEAIYHKLYWNPIRGDQLPAGVDYAVFDFAVNSGAHEAAICLQRVTGVTADGFIGAITIEAVRSADPLRIINGICTERLAYLETLPTFGHFGDGWTNRVNSVEITARGMA